MAERCSQPWLVVYDAEQCIEILVERDGLTYDEAEEYFSFNVTGAWVGEHTPLFLWRPEVEPDDPAEELRVRRSPGSTRRAMP